MNIQSTSAYQAWGYPGVVITALILIALTAIISAVAVRVARKMLHFTTNGEVGGSIITNIIRVVVWALGISIILQTCLGINPSVIWGALGIGGIALSLGLQNTVSNLIGGLQLSLSRDVSVGDWIIIGSGQPAKVQDINWRLVKLEDENGILYLVPNSVVNTTPVTVLPEPYVLLFDLAVAPSADISAIKEDIIRIAHDALVEAGMNFSERRPLLSISGSGVDVQFAHLKVFASRDYTQIQINNVVVPPVLAYLREHGMQAHCYSSDDAAKQG